ncbi:hypothetical protein L6452_37322 [Arctium lappa]|uniref:Uncharacterized protein n=1 Tax=Arctium lappa TaxID=4217 RepID=A0ACB8Y471_ARCLA|nr:hypothetical protein L6452_37322 [Arctium lappa]
MEPKLRGQRRLLVDDRPKLRSPHLLYFFSLYHSNIYSETPREKQRGYRNKKEESFKTLPIAIQSSRLNCSDFQNI